SFDRFLPRVAAELDHQPAAPRGQKRDVVQAQPALAQSADDALVETLAGDRAGSKHFGHRIAGGEDVREAAHHEHALARTLHESRLGLQGKRAGALRADKSARHVEAVFRQELVEVVPRYAPANAREATADELTVALD